MRPDITSSHTTALADDTIIGAWMVHLDIVDDPVYVWTGPHELSYDSQTWTGVGGLGEVSNVESDIKGNLTNIDVVLTGLDTTILASVKAVKYRGRNAQIYLALLDRDDFTLIDNPISMFAGPISSMRLHGGERKISVSIESRMASLQRNYPRYRTDEDQQREYLYDSFFAYLPKLANKQIYWGLKGVYSGVGSAGFGSSSGSGGVNYRPTFSL